MNNTIRRQVKDLWKLCFDDNEKFIDLYFNLRFNQHVNISIESGNRIIAALQMLPYSFTYYGEDFQTSYISGACTHPDYRNKGVMHRLIGSALARMSVEGITFGALIPAEDWLYDYYAKQGFAPVFDYAIRDITYTPLKQSCSKIERISEFRPDVYKYLNFKMHKRDFYIQHSDSDIKVVMEDMKVEENGNVWIASRESNVVGVMFVYNENGTNYIAELLTDTNKVKQELIQAICNNEPHVPLKLIAPVNEKDEHIRHGMIRIINVPKALQFFAVHHPDLIMNLIINDPMLSSNNNYYYLYKGRCMVSKEKLPGKHTEFTMTQLAQFIFEGVHPYMSLMMD